MLFLSTLTFELSALLKLNPLPLLLAEIAAANIGGAATLVGDPPNVILGTHFYLSFADFAAGTGPIALAALALNTALFVAFFKKDIYPRRAIPPEKLENPWEAVPDRPFFYLCVFTFLLVVSLLMTHHLTHLSVGTVAIIGVLVQLLAGRNKVFQTLRHFEWDNLFFFGGLFLIVNGLEVTGLLKMAANSIASVTGGNPTFTVTLVLWFSALGSSFVDNVPFAATMAPLIGHLASNTQYLRPMVWATALGTDIGGNGTPIGASANVVAISNYEKTTGEKVGWGFYCKYSYTAMVIVVGLCNLLLLTMYYL